MLYSVRKMLCIWVTYLLQFKSPAPLLFIATDWSIYRWMDVKLQVVSEQQFHDPSSPQFNF